MGRREKSVSAKDGPAQALGAALRNARQTSGATLNHFAQQLGYTKGHLSSVETGAVWPSQEFVEAYERALGLDAGELTRARDSLLAMRNGHPRRELDHSGVGQILANVRDGLGAALRVDPAETHSRVVASPASRRMLLHGQGAILERAIHLVEQASRTSPPLGEQIVFTFEAPSEAGTRSSRLDERWRRVLHEALDHGWDVVQISRLDDPGQSHVALVNQMLELVGSAGRYNALALPATAVTLPYDFLVVPGHGAILSLVTRNNPAVQSAYVFRHPEQYRVLRDHAEVLKSQATPVFSAYCHPLQTDEDPARYSAIMQYDLALSRQSLRAGERILVKNGMSNLSLPDDILQKRARAFVRANGQASASWVRAIVESRRQRAAAFRQQVQTWRFRHMCSRRSVQRMMASRVCVLNSWLQEPTIAEEHCEPGVLRLPVTREERARELLAVIDVLKTYPNYELALMDDDVADEVGDVFWEVKSANDEEALFLYSWYPRGDYRAEVYLEITQAQVVRAFRAYFADRWDRLPGVCRQKDDVVAWLQAQVA